METFKIICQGVFLGTLAGFVYCGFLMLWNQITRRKR